MNEHILYLFPDTNVFIQCKSLDQLDWSEWEEFTEVHLMVSRPVQREIDNQKSRGNNRVADKARTTSSLFREVVLSQQGFELIQDFNPSVKLYIEEESQPSSELKGSLDYSKPDDEIVGCLYRFKRENPEADIRLLTHDTGPMMTAKSHGIPFEPVNESWLLPPEHNELERENTRLQQVILQLERTGPQFEIALVDHEGRILTSLTIEFLVYEPLSRADLGTLVDQLSNRFPMADDFGPRESLEIEDTQPVVGRTGLVRTYTPPPTDEIDRYTDQYYPGWVQKCEEVLSNIYEALQRRAGRPIFEFAISNKGTRPGNDAIVHITVMGNGNLQIRPPRYIPEEEEDNSSQGLALPSPPNPPRGHWRLNFPQVDRAVKGFRARAGFAQGLLDSLVRPIDSTLFALPPASRENRRDPNQFYYKPTRPSEPGDSFSLECEQWRHGTGWEHFVGEIIFESDIKSVQGLLKCEVHAENLSFPVSEQYPVRINVKRTSSYEACQKLVQELIDHNKSAEPPHNFEEWN